MDATLLTSKKGLVAKARKLPETTDNTLPFSIISGIKMSCAH